MLTREGSVIYPTQSSQVATNDLPSWMYPHGTYGMMSYNKTAVWLHTLEGLIGTETMDNVFREYYRRWAFRHPSGRDFIAVVNDVVKSEHGDRFGENMNWYFDQVLYGNEICDYRLPVLQTIRSGSYAGIVDGDTVTFTRSDQSSDSVYISRVSIERLGGVTLPVEVLIHFDNGDEVLEQWDGKARYKDFEYTGTSKVVWVKIDPYDKIDIDVDRINNSSCKELIIQCHAPDDEQIHISHADDDLTVHNLIFRVWILSEYLKREPLRRHHHINSCLLCGLLPW